MHPPRAMADAALTEARRQLNRTMSEKQFQQLVVDYAETRGWHWHHETDSRLSRAGLPDLLLCRPPRVVFAELKAQDGRLSPPQQRWISLLSRCPGVAVHVWRPDDWPTIEEVLR
jgi:hypothetical protein